MVDARGTHGLSCRKSAGRGVRHQQLNDLVYMALIRVDIPAAKSQLGWSALIARDQNYRGKVTLRYGLMDVIVI